MRGLAVRNRNGVRRSLLATATLVTVLGVASGCGSDGSGSKGNSDGKVGGFAMIQSGPIADGDYGAVGHTAVQDVKKSGIASKTAESENIDVADAARVAREYIADGYSVIGFHSGIYVPVALELAKTFPDTTFVIESSGHLEDRPANVWNLARSYYPSYYAIGKLAAETTKTGTVGFVGPIMFPDAVKSASSFLQGVKDANPNVKAVYGFSGDFYDNVKAKQTTAALIDKDADVLVTWISTASAGIADAVKEAPRPTTWMSLNTDKYEQDPDHFVFSPIFDFDTAFRTVVEKVAAGEKGGELPMDIQGGLVKPSEVHNTDPTIAKNFLALWNDIKSGKVKVDEPPADKIVEP